MFVGVVMRVVEILLLILVALYVVAAAFYIYSSSTPIINRTSGREISTPNIANLPKNFTGETLYLYYRVDGYVNISGGLVNINNAMVGITVSYTAEPETTNATSGGGNSTAATNTSRVNIYYIVSANGDQAIIWALRQLVIATSNASQNLSIDSGWIANNVSDIFGNLSIFSKTGEGQLQGGSGIAYTEYSLRTSGGTITVKIAKDLGVPLECIINTEWGNIRFRLVSAS